MEITIIPRGQKGTKLTSDELVEGFGQYLNENGSTNIMALAQERLLGSFLATFEAQEAPDLGFVQDDGFAIADSTLKYGKVQEFKEETI